MDYSQNGEHGILKQILSDIPNNGWCVEFGAWDGYLYSNTRGLIEEGWKAVLIEGNAKRCKQLRDNDPDSVVINAYVNEKNKLDSLLGDIPKDFDVLSIDIDGDDYHVWSDVWTYKPKIVVIEYNETIPTFFINPKGSQVGSSLLALNNLAISKGYSFHSATAANLIFVDKKYLKKASPLPEIGGSVVFFGYDGSVHYEGKKCLQWHGVRMKEVQTLPFYLRRFPSNYNLLQKVLFKLYQLFKG